MPNKFAFIPLTKVDVEQRLVYGCATQEVLDKANEVLDYETSKPLFQKWSSEIHDASNGLSKGNVRAMHGKVVAGKLTEIDFDDENKAIHVCAKIVDNDEWAKIQEGCYTGFSIGGKYVKRWTENGVKKFTADPNEVSVVDNPCVSSATFSLIKADGVVEDTNFKVVEKDAENNVDELKDKLDKFLKVDSEEILKIKANKELIKSLSEKDPSISLLINLTDDVVKLNGLDIESDEIKEVLASLSKQLVDYTEAVLKSTQEPADVEKAVADLKSNRDDYKELAERAVMAVEKLTKRVKELEDTPLPRAPLGVSKTSFLGREIGSEEEKLEVLREMVKTMGPDNLATLLIKESQNSGGRKLVF